MTAFLIQHEASLRLMVFIGLLLMFLLWQEWQPKRALRLSRMLRWGNNLLLVMVNSMVLRLLFPTATIGMALWVQNLELGVFNVLPWPFFLETLLAILILDCAIYWQHRIFHAVPILWRLHRVHHVDQDIDVSTGVRFHPLEIILSMLIKFCMIVLLGPSVLAVIVFEMLLNATSLFNHANINLAKKLDGVLRTFLVTPDVHRIHHSRVPTETNSNYGFNLIWWDKLFGSYQAQPKFGHDKMEIGVKGFDHIPLTQHVWQLLCLPFKK